MTELKNKNILITGANGFVGLHLARYLKNKGALVSVIIVDSKGIEDLKKIGVEIFICDLRNKPALDEVILKNNPQYIYHLAAIGSIPYSVKNPEETMHVNFLGTLNLLELIRNKNIKKFIYISSAEIYQTNNLPVDENSNIEASSPYSASKIAADYLVSSYIATYNIPAVIFRPCNIYGVGNIKNVIYLFCKAALCGEDLNIEGGEQKKAFLYIDDFLSALFLASDQEKFNGEIFNIGSKNFISILDLAKKIIKLTFSNSKINIKKLRNLGSKNLICNTKKVENLLDWQERTSLEEGLNNVINSLKE